MPRAPHLDFALKFSAFFHAFVQNSGTIFINENFIDKLLSRYFVQTFHVVKKNGTVASIFKGSLVMQVGATISDRVVTWCLSAQPYQLQPDLCW